MAALLGVGRVGRAPDLRSSSALKLGQAGMFQAVLLHVQDRGSVSKGPGTYAEVGLVTAS